MELQGERSETKWKFVLFESKPEGESKSELQFNRRIKNKSNNTETLA